MSIISDLKTFASKVEAEFIKLFTKAPAILQIATGVVSYLAPLVVGIVTELNPVEGSATAAAVSVIESGLAALSAAAKSLASATTIQQIVADLEAALPSLLAAVKVENSALVEKVEAFVSLFGSEITAISSAL